MSRHSLLDNQNPVPPYREQIPPPRVPIVTSYQSPNPISQRQSIPHLIINLTVLPLSVHVPGLTFSIQQHLGMAYNPTHIPQFTPIWTLISEFHWSLSNHYPEVHMYHASTNTWPDRKTIPIGV